MTPNRSTPVTGSSFTHSGLPIGYSKPDLMKDGQVNFSSETGTSSQAPSLKSDSWGTVAQHLILSALA